MPLSHMLVPNKQEQHKKGVFFCAHDVILSQTSNGPSNKSKSLFDILTQ